MARVLVYMQIDAANQARMAQQPCCKAHNTRNIRRLRPITAQVRGVDAAAATGLLQHPTNCCADLQEAADGLWFIGIAVVLDNQLEHICNLCTTTEMHCVELAL